MKFNQVKKWYESLGVNSGLVSILVIVLGMTGITITADDITQAYNLIPAVIGSIGLVYTRIAQKTRGLSVGGWVSLFTGIVGSGWMAFGVDKETIDLLISQSTALASVVFNLFSAFGIHRADKSIG